MQAWVLQLQGWRQYDGSDSSDVREVIGLLLDMLAFT